MRPQPGRQTNGKETPRKHAFLAPEVIPRLALTTAFMHQSHTVSRASLSFPSKSWLAAFYLAAISICNILMSPERHDFLTLQSFAFTAQKIF